MASAITLLQFSSQALPGLVCKSRGADPRHHQEKERMTRFAVCRWQQSRIAKLHARLQFFNAALFLDGPAIALRDRAYVCHMLAKRSHFKFLFKPQRPGSRRSGLCWDSNRHGTLFFLARLRLTPV